MAKIERALVSVTRKEGLLDVARVLVSFGVELVASGGTAEHLSQAGLKVSKVSDLTHAPEMMDGRVKTLHPRIHGGILWRRDHAKDQTELVENGIRSIDLVICNLYDFDSNPGIETIDVGGPSMIRGAAKNHQWVTVLTDPSQYGEFLKEFTENQGQVSLELRRRCAADAFALLSAYDASISLYLRPLQESEGSEISIQMPKALHLRYGENPQQNAALFYPGGELPFEQIQGKELSFNNLVDMDSAWDMIESATRFEGFHGDMNVFSVVIKHQNPCGFGRAQDGYQAWNRALQGSPEATFGGIVGFSHRVDEVVAKELTDLFLEVIVAPDFSMSALDLFSKKKNLRIIRWPLQVSSKHQLRSWREGLLMQERDSFEPLQQWKVVTKRQPSADQMRAAQLAWFVSRFVKSNAIVAADSSRVRAVGAGQMSRIDSVRMVGQKLNEESSVDWAQLAVASDAFFPFKDSVETMAQWGVSCIIQPMGSIRDAEVVEACDRLNISMIATGTRHFYH